MTEGHDDRVAFLADGIRSSRLSRVCPTGTTTTTTSGAFNTAAQLTSTTVTGAGSGSGAYVYDGLGRTSTVPAIDTTNPAGENLTLGFYSTDKPATQTLGATTQTFGLDPVGRADTTTTTTTGGSTTTASAFDGGGDSPAWTSATGGAWTRFIDGPGGSLAMQATGTGAEATSASLMLINPHGDITATIPNTANVAAAQITGINDTDEYGVVTSSPAPSPYGWVGAAQRSTADQAGLILMGARQYNPATGRFLTLDPTPGGNPNPYTYPVDPVNGYDLSGQFSLGGWLVAIVTVVAAPILAPIIVARAVWSIPVVHSTVTKAWRASPARAILEMQASIAIKYIKRANTYHRTKKGAGSTASIGQRDWGTAAAGVANIGYGVSSVESGVAALFPSVAVAPETGGTSLLVTAGAVYRIGSGAARALRGARQMNALNDDCGSYCGLDDQASRFVIGVAPGGGFATEHGDMLDKLGSLP